ncbi:MAG: HEAT repeat domain-containing protein, partial [Aggregatilineales bacterium]
KIGTTDAIQTLISLLSCKLPIYDTDWGTGYPDSYAAQALIELGELGVEQLIQTLKSLSQKARTPTSVGLLPDGSPVFEGTLSPKPNPVPIIFTILSRIGGQRVFEFFLDALADSYYHNQAMIVTDPNARAWWAAQLAGSDYHNQAMIGLASGNFSDPRMIGILIEALNDPDGHVQMLAAKALGNKGDKRAIVPLKNFVQKPRISKQTRETAIRALRQLDG